ncbi:AraC family transcriptional regulator [Mucilaginibacter flavus]|uniref:AraC family transcriptional regulator n=1 Tax=Mucilaginibacter flavus TaxID=931504 RepID=UPI0025B50287|nr:AraC family transcriptional regulator [Mucilaginibacter flavus]MDN3584708.1 AraC family transcriptional regulator [Mucilaginibacter flavus]
MKKEFPVYDICKFTHTQEEDVIIKPFAPYLKAMRKLHFPHRHDFYHMVFFTRGAGTHSVDFETFNIQPYHIYFMAPGQVHGWSFEGEVDGYVVNFSAGFFKSFLLDSQYLDNFPFFSGNVQYSVMDIPAAEQSAAITVMEKAVKEADSRGRFRLDTLRVLLLEFFLLLVKSTGADKANNKVGHNHALLRNYEKLIEQNYTNHRLPKFYAELLSITPSHLNAICKELLGISAGDMIRNRIVLEAKRMLVNLDLTVTQVAYSLNFEDNSYFCKFFKNQSGVSPEAFRKGI